MVCTQPPIIASPSHSHSSSHLHTITPAPFLLAPHSLLHLPLCSPTVGVPFIPVFALLSGHHQALPTPRFLSTALCLLLAAQHCHLPCLPRQLQHVGSLSFCSSVSTVPHPTPVLPSAGPSGATATSACRKDSVYVSHASSLPVPCWLYRDLLFALFARGPQ